MSNAAAVRDRIPGDDERATVRWARPVLIALTALCALGLAVRFVGEPLTVIRHVVVQSDIALADDQVLALSGIQGTDHWYALSTTSVQHRLEASPLVRRAAVVKVFPDTVRLTVWGRQPAALVVATSAGRSLPVLVDGDGVVFKVGTTSAELDLPVVSGLSAGDTVLGGRLPRAYLQVFSDLRGLKGRSPSLYALVSEVRVVPVPGATAEAGSPQDFDLLVYLTSATVPVRIRGALDEGVMKNALIVLDLLSRQGVLKDIQELDFRSGDVVYKRGAAGAKGG